MVGRQRAFTLIEIAFSIFILGVGLLGIALVLPRASAHAAEVEKRLLVSQAASELQRALRLGAADAREVWTQTSAGPELSATYFLLPYAAASAGAAPAPALSPYNAVDRSVFSRPNCILLPRTSDKVFVYPRAWNEAEIGTKNGDGSEALATDDRDSDRDYSQPVSRAVYVLDPPRPERPRASLSVALSIQRKVLRGQPIEGLYHVKLLFFTSPEPLNQSGEHTLELRVDTELCVGPSAIATGGSGFPAGGALNLPWTPQALGARQARLEGRAWEPPVDNGGRSSDTPGVVELGDHPRTGRR